MATKSHIGINNVARKNKNIYIGVNNIARKIKKIYVGGKDGLAQLIYNRIQNVASIDFNETLNYTSTDMIAATADNKLAIFLGGVIKGSSSERNPYAYGIDNNLTLTSKYIGTDYSSQYGCAVSLNKHALFAGGYEKLDNPHTVVAYDSNFSKTYPMTLHTDSSVHSGTCMQTKNNGTVALINNYPYITPITENLTKLDSIPSSKSCSQATTIKDLAIFMDNRDYQVVTINSNLTVIQNSLNTDRYRMGLAATGDKQFAIIAGGYRLSSNTAVSVSSCYALNSSLTKIGIESLTHSRYAICGITMGDDAVFAGGWDSSYQTGIVEVFTSELTKKAYPTIHAARNIAGTCLQDKAIFAGGQQTDSFVRSISVLKIS